MDITTAQFLYWNNQKYGWAKNNYNFGHINRFFFPVQSYARASEL